MADESKSPLEQPLDPLKEALKNGPDGAGEVCESTPKATEAPPSPRPGSAAGKGGPLLAQFRAFAKFGDTKADGRTITLSQSDKWRVAAKFRFCERCFF